MPLIVEVERTTITDDLTNAVVTFSASGGNGEYYVSKSSDFPAQISLISITSDRIKALVKLVKDDTLFYLDSVTAFKYSVGLKTDLGLMELESGFFNVNPSLSLGKDSQAPVPDAPATVELTAPKAGDKLSVGKAFKLLAKAADQGGAVEKVEFFANEIKIGTNSSYSVKGIWDFRYQPIQAGSVTFYAIAHDSSGNTSKSNAVAVTVEPERIPPTPNFSFVPLSGAAPLSVTFVNTSVNAASYIWDFGDGTAVSSAIAPTHVYTASGNYTITLTATNQFGGVLISKTIAVSAAVNQPPAVSISNPANNTNIVAGQQITLTANASDDGAIAAVLFKVNGADQGTAKTAPPFTQAWTPPTSGNYTIIAIATDNLGVSTSSNPVYVNVTASAANPTPTISVTAPKAGLVNEAQTLNATAAVTGDTISGVQFRVNGANEGAPDTTSPYTRAWTPTAKGIYSISAIATAALGGTATSATLSVPVYDTKVTTEGAGTSLAANPGDYVLLDNNQNAGGLPAGADLFVGSEPVGVLNYSADAYNGKAFAFFRASNQTMYTGIVASGTVQLNG